MTRDDIIRMAREAGGSREDPSDLLTLDILERFAELVAANDTALLRQCLEALEAVAPYTDRLICYASTVDEHPPNAIDGRVHTAVTALRARLEGEQ